MRETPLSAERASREPGWKDARALVSFGAPYLGSLNALVGKLEQTSPRFKLKRRLQPVHQPRVTVNLPESWDHTEVLHQACSFHAVAEIVERRVVHALDGQTPDVPPPMVTIFQIAAVEAPQTSLPSLAKTLPLIPGRTMTRSLYM